MGYSPNREIRATGRYLLLLRRQFPYMSFFALAPRTLSDLQKGMLSKQSSSASFLPKADKTKGRHQAKDHARYAARFFVDLTPALKQTMPKAEHCVLQDVAIETRGHPVCFFIAPAGRQRDAKEFFRCYCFSVLLSGIVTVTTVPPPSLGVMVRLPPHMSSSL